MDIDYLIVGQGLAGSLIAWELIQRQQKVIVVDNGKENASLMAAGLINPITGMRFVKSTHVDQLLPVAIDYYQQLSDYFQQTFYIEKTMLRLLGNHKERIACQKRLQQPDYQKYLTSLMPSPSSLSIYCPGGIIQQKCTGYLRTQALLKALKEYFISIHAYVKAEIDYQEIMLTPCLHWRDFRPKKIIFCEGHHASKNPWFSWLPFQPVKGEIITATATEKIPTNILNYGHWFIPLDSHQFRTGATFDRENLNTDTTEQAKETLLCSLKKILPAIKLDPFIKQQAGIRPTTKDKHPFIGTHPTRSELVIFNGFGSKGSLQTPWYGQCLADNLLNNLPLPYSSDIHRYDQLINNQAKNA